MRTIWLKLDLKSDATFGRGDGVAGLVDAEVQHDDYGCPYLGGRTLKGMLHEECVNLLYALEQMGKAKRWSAAANHLFGTGGSAPGVRACLRVGDALLPEELRTTVRSAIDAQPPTLTRTQVLESLTTLRRQTAIDVVTGAPLKETLRTARVILRETPFWAELTLDLRKDVLDQVDALAQLGAIAQDDAPPGATSTEEAPVDTAAVDTAAVDTAAVDTAAADSPDLASPDAAAATAAKATAAEAAIANAAEADALALLAACVMALRQVGSGRNRGRGEVQATLWDEHKQADQTEKWFELFAKEVAGVRV